MSFQSTVEQLKADISTLEEVYSKLQTPVAKAMITRWLNKAQYDLKNAQKYLGQK